MCILEGKMSLTGTLLSSSGAPGRTRQDSTSLRKPCGLRKEEVIFCLSWSSCWFSLGTQQNIKFSARFGSYPLLYLLYLLDQLPCLEICWCEHVFAFLYIWTSTSVCLYTCACVLRHECSCWSSHFWDRDKSSKMALQQWIQDGNHIHC